MILGVLLACVVSTAQFEPENAHVLLYFPQLADGGAPNDQRWQTVLTFMNPSEYSATVAVYFYGNDGAGLPLDFGAGARAEFSFTIPAGGVRVFRSRIASQQIVTGWAIAAASHPIQGIVTFRMLNGSTPVVEIADQATSPTSVYSSFANRDLGIAVANIYTNYTVALRMTLRDNNGQALGSSDFTIPPLGHAAFNVWARFANLPVGFYGSIEISPQGGNADCFVAWTLNASDGGLLSSLPSGRYAAPISHHDRIWKVYRKVASAVNALHPGDFATPVNLTINNEREINAYARMDGSSITINTALSELMGDSDGELASVIAHEFGHIYQARTGRLVFSDNAELDADSWALLFVIIAGYDPYAAAGAFGKAQMISPLPGMLGEQYREETSHRSFSTRIETVYSLIQTVCATPEGREFCPMYKGIFHPHFPSSIPLARPPAARLQ